MFNSSAKREAIDKLKAWVKRHERIRKEVERASVRLFAQRRRAADDVIEPVERYVNLLANSPKEFDRTVARFRIEVNRFSGTVRRIETEAARATRIGSATGAAGAAAGVGVATLGSSAAMAIATTFGTASTGTAISALSGVAATNAALAWLGGGAIAAGGGGMAGGTALLALTGPVGWAIGGTALVGSGIFLNRRNKKAAEEATRQRVEIESQTLSLQTAYREVQGLEATTKRHVEGCLSTLDWLKMRAPYDYQQFDQEQKERLAALINHVRSLGELISKEVVLGASQSRSSAPKSAARAASSQESVQRPSWARLTSGYWQARWFGMTLMISESANGGFVWNVRKSDGTLIIGWTWDASLEEAKMNSANAAMLAAGARNN